jgi:hypothetical protein
VLRLTCKKRSNPLAYSVYGLVFFVHVVPISIISIYYHQHLIDVPGCIESQKTSMQRHLFLSLINPHFRAMPLAAGHGQIKAVSSFLSDLGGIACGTRA